MNIKYITTVMLAKNLGVTQQYIRKLISIGKIKAIKLGHDWLIDVHDIRHLRVKERKKNGNTKLSIK